MVFLGYKNMIEQFRTDTSPRHQRRAKFTEAGQTTQSTTDAADYCSSQEWWRLRVAIMKALQGYPEAREAVLSALRSLHALDGAQ